MFNKSLLTGGAKGCPRRYGARCLYGLPQPTLAIRAHPNLADHLLTCELAGATSLTPRIPVHNPTHTSGMDLTEAETLQEACHTFQLLSRES